MDTGCFVHVPARSDEEHAKRLRNAIENLQEAADAARDAGLRVEFREKPVMVGPLERVWRLHADIERVESF